MAIKQRITDEYAAELMLKGGVLTTYNNDKILHKVNRTTGEHYVEHKVRTGYYIKYQRSIYYITVATAKGLKVPAHLIAKEED